MFLVVDKLRRRVVSSSPDKQVAVEYALKYSNLGGTEYIVAEVLGETKQVTTSVFQENRNAQLGPLTNEVKRVGGIPISELRERTANSGETLSGGAVLAAGVVDRSELLPVLQGVGVEGGQLGDIGDVAADARLSFGTEGRDN